jgi:hypothetical protein
VLERRPSADGRWGKRRYKNHSSLLSGLLKNDFRVCHAERSEESRTENTGNARFLVAKGSSE